MRLGILLVVAVAAFALNGCIGAGLMAVRMASGALHKDKSPSERLIAEQDKAISQARGGSPGIPIGWSDAESGIEGAFMLESGGSVPQSCRRYRQTIVIAGETLQGEIVSCLQKNGSWKLEGEKSGGKGFDLSRLGGRGMLENTVSKRLFKKKLPAERIAAEQNKAISAAHGGSPGIPIPWSDAKSGIDGAFLLEPNANTPQGCRQFRQTIIIGGETLQGLIAAHRQRDGSWKLAGEKPGE